MTFDPALIRAVRLEYEHGTRPATIGVPLRTAFLWTVTAPGYAVGWIVGFTIRCILWSIAAVQAGYKDGIGDNE